jgi:superfamily II RNA helicase
MMTGKKSTFQSRMTFHYEFILKTFQRKELRWLDILGQSYWYCRHSQLIQACEKEIASLANTDYISEEEIAEMSVFEGLQDKVKNTVNASRRAAQRELEAWKNTHQGARWYKVEKEAWPRYKRDRKEIAGLEKDLVALKEPERDVYPVLKTLEDFGFMSDGQLTPLGIMSTEVNEAHTILMPLFWNSLTRLSLSPQETLATLAVFLGEGNPDQNYVSSANVQKSIDEIGAIAKKCMEIERVNRLTSPTSSYWNISTEYVEIVWKWINGTSINEITGEYGIFEGNFIRILMKLASILEEWRVLASIAKDTTTLNNLADAHNLLQVGFASSESLYLNL